jgi:hypothetical protein
MDVLKFFDTFISKYPIYQDNRVYQILIDKFKEVFLQDTYEDIPVVFKQLYEKSEIPSEVYDYFLVDIGVSNDLIKELSTSEKLVFIKSLADFQKYKSTVGLVENVIKAYGNNVEVYELYIDYNKSYDRWDCKPYPIYKPDHSDGYNKTIPYSLVYEKIPSLLIHEKQLDKMKQSNLAVFPIKSNIVFVTSNYNQSITSYIQNLIISVFYKHYFEESINLYFSDKLISCNFHQFILIWLYLLFTKNTTSYIDRKLDGLYINFNKDLLDITIEELDSIIEEYENIDINDPTQILDRNGSFSTKMDNFYYTYIYPQRSELTSSNSVLNKTEIESWLKSENPTLINYINSQISDSSDNITILFSDLINSLETYKKTSTDENFIKYFRYFKTFLPSVDLLPSQSTVYKILYYIKPFHTEFLDLVDQSMIVSNDTFNNIYFTHFYQNTLFFKYDDIIELENFNKFFMLKKSFEDLAAVSAISKFTGLISNSDELSFDDSILVFLQYYNDSYTIEDSIIFLFSPQDPTEYALLYNTYGW